MRRLPPALLALLAAGCAAGCTSIEKLPPGSQLQTTTFGLKFSPQSLDGTPLALGSHTVTVTTAQPSDGGVNLNRYEASAPFVNLKSTIASGPVGEQLREAGGPDALKYLLPNNGPGGYSLPE